MGLLDSYMDELKSVAVIGSTGSVGEQALDVISSMPEKFHAIALAAGSNEKRLNEQIKLFQPKAVFLASGLSSTTNITKKIYQPLEEIVVRDDVDIVLAASSGLDGLPSIIAALRAGKKVALANKEALVVGGPAVRQALEFGKPYGAELRPVDSEHSAIWQCLWGESIDQVQQLILTASGGAFRNLSISELDNVTPNEALKHPTWQMGPKVTIDSATLFNKGLEALEARWLFDIPLEKIDILQHRESVIHSMVEFIDGSVKAQLGVPDMRLPIQIALSYPSRLPMQPAPKLNLVEYESLNFSKVNSKKFPALEIVIEAGKREDTTAAALSGADEVAVANFLDEKCRFTDIAKLLHEVIQTHEPQKNPNLDYLLAAEKWGRDFVAQILNQGERV